MTQAKPKTTTVRVVCAEFSWSRLTSIVLRAGRGEQQEGQQEQGGGDGGRTCCVSANGPVWQRRHQ